MNRARSSIAATLLTSGQVRVIGPVENPAEGIVAELFNPRCPQVRF
jgi:hypothetical protein